MDGCETTFLVSGARNRDANARNDGGGGGR